MKEKLKDLRLNITISAVVSIIIGILLVVRPAESLSTIGNIIGAIVILLGVGIIIGQIYERGFNAMGIVVGAVLAIIGIWIFKSPEAILSIIPMAIGVVLVVHGIQDLGLAVEAVKVHAPRSWLPFVIAGFNIALGVLCVVASFKIISLATQLIGVMLVYDGITDIGIVHKVRKASNLVVDSTIISEEDI
ncbi:Uncharacterized membrane protein HdeD, DUF308 family [Pseudobutyrivibrio sp. YE44]|uniref:HdeD family acid-resistance protein n=1 Tax=Pseudobutyrivibrio sp. YE44 TaxID=1520802 RepID=UPI00088BE4D2|nr:DUF308 domain-containing protein [Pseudobutyrivibrio sp. YE44]SDB19141.1 Uncharacterized membrane protein HdeD, DUF308 family [Pseudobutyrivibrio sp. YE44]